MLCNEKKETGAAVYHLHAHYIAKSTAGSLEQSVLYIARLGRFRGRGDTVRKVINLHMPAWAASDAMMYWQMADSALSRANARGGCRIEFALPRILPHSAQRALVMNFALELSRLTVDGQALHGTLPITLAMHEGYGRNPHVHLLMSSSINDDIERVAAQWFRRFNPAHPERGGARRSRIMCKTPWLLQVRSAWARLANQALAAAGFAPVMTHTSHAAQGYPAVPAVHLGPSIAASLRQGRLTQRGQRYGLANQCNQAIFALQESIEKSRKRLAAMQVKDELEAQAYARWQVRDAQVCQHAFQDHPLAAGANLLKEHATLLLIDATNILPEEHGHALDNPMFERQLMLMLGDGWQGIRTPAGLWLVRPGLDEVVLVATGYVATDGLDQASLQAVQGAARILSFSDATIFVNPKFNDLLPTEFREYSPLLRSKHVKTSTGRPNCPALFEGIPLQHPRRK